MIRAFGVTFGAKVGSWDGKWRPGLALFELFCSRCPVVVFCNEVLYLWTCSRFMRQFLFKLAQVLRNSHTGMVLLDNYQRFDLELLDILL
jgi:hypothetical protein